MATNTEKKICRRCGLGGRAKFIISEILYEEIIYAQIKYMKFQMFHRFYVQ